MNVAFFSPLPPARSGIADYSAALLEHMPADVRVTAFASADPSFDASRFDAVIYQVGNNGHHGFVYEQALRAPGIVVMHELNLHHLMAELTIRRGDWDGYLAECEYNGGAAALEYARRVRALEVGPDYDGLLMTRRLLESARALVVHSRFMATAMRAAGFRGPIARIPHGAWVPKVDRSAWRHRLGLDESTPLVGVFGFLKPYKRIAESLRAFRRLVRVHPQARMILAGEEHPDFPVRSLIRTLELAAEARVIGFAPIEDFVGYLGACDIVLNLRYPTVGESSGSLLRALGLGKAVLVSSVGSFDEFPDEVCLKTPVDRSEEDLIYEYLNLLVSRPDIARGYGERARAWVERECNWDLVARRYTEFARLVAESRAPELFEPAAPPAEIAPAGPQVPGEDIAGWAADEESRVYIETHRTRLEKTLAITPPGGPNDRVLEMGAYLQ
ncbi:MAG: glycosyltransferase, partial [Bryobacteraceae bacterium]